MYFLSLLKVSCPSWWVCLRRRLSNSPPTIRWETFSGVKMEAYHSGRSASQEERLVVGFVCWKSVYWLYGVCTDLRVQCKCFMHVHVYVAHFLSTCTSTNLYISAHPHITQCIWSGFFPRNIWSIADGRDLGGVCVHNGLASDKSWYTCTLYIEGIGRGG